MSVHVSRMSVQRTVCAAACNQGTLTFVLSLSCMIAASIGYMHLCCVLGPEEPCLHTRPPGMRYTRPPGMRFFSPLILP